MARDKVDVPRRMVDAYNRRDVDGVFAELATPDFEWYPGIVRALDGSGYRGREGAERFRRGNGRFPLAVDDSPTAPQPSGP
jgi:hypothetical protein